MKVELEKITLGHSELTDRIFAGTLVRPGLWRNKKDVTNEFIGCVISRWENQTETIESGENKWQITVKKITRKIKIERVEPKKPFNSTNSRPTRICDLCDGTEKNGHEDWCPEKDTKI